MKYHKRIIEMESLLTSLLLLLFSYATAQQMQQETKGRTIDMVSYTIEAPHGEDWKVEIEKEKGIIRFTKEEKQKFLGLLAGKTQRYTLIQVFRNRVKAEGIHFSEEEVADDFRKREEKDMIERGVETKQYDLTDVKKGITSIGDKKLYFMSYRTTSIKIRSQGEAVLYLYFPSDFKKTHNFYGFLINKAYSLDKPVKADLTQIYPVINSFKIISLKQQVLQRFKPPTDAPDLLHAAWKGDRSTVKKLLDEGANVNVKDKIGDTALVYAAGHGHIEIVKLLIEKGADVNNRSVDGHTVLKTAVISGRTDILSILLNKGADVNAKDFVHGWTALMFAIAAAGDTEIATFLIDKGANINEKNFQGQTALTLASHHGHTEIAKVLIDRGADINAQMNDGWTPLTDAIDSHHVEIAKLLIEKGADVNLKSKKGWTVLMAAVSSGNTEIVKLLVEKGADINAKNEAGATALKIAKAFKRSEIIRLLEMAGAKE